MAIKRTKLTLTIKCKDCGAVYFFNAIYGGVEIDKETTMTVAEAYEAGDIVELKNNESVQLSECKCKI
jgi:hypothetical protein